MTQFLSTPPLDPRLTDGVLPRRFLALIIDCICINIVGWAAVFLIALFGVLTLGIGWLGFHVIPFIPLAYYTLLVGGTGATPGQRLAGLTVRQDDNWATPPNLAQGLVWTVLLWLSFWLAGIPFLLALLNPRGRMGHDILSGLVVIRSR